MDLKVVFKSIFFAYICRIKHIKQNIKQTINHAENNT